jgi:hypothetical protein
MEAFATASCFAHGTACCLDKFIFNSGEAYACNFRNRGTGGKMELVTEERVPVKLFPASYFKICC